MTIRRFGILIMIVALTFAARTRAQGTLDQGLRARLDNAPVVLEAGCGAWNDAICAAVLPKLAARAARAGVVLRPVAIADPAASVCNGWAAVAILPRDAIACMGGFDIVGRPLSPFYAILVVAANRRPDDPPHSIVTDTAGAAMIGNLGWGPEIAVTDGGLDQSLRRVRDGSADALFAVAALDGDLIDRVRRAANVYTVLDVLPGAASFRIGDGEGHCLYREVALDFGGKAPVTTVAVDAVLVLGREFRDAHARGGPPVRDVLASAFEIETKSSRSWRSEATSCH